MPRLDDVLQHERDLERIRRRLERDHREPAAPVVDVRDEAVGEVRAEVAAVATRRLDHGGSSGCRCADRGRGDARRGPEVAGGDEGDGQPAADDGRAGVRVGIHPPSLEENRSHLRQDDVPAAT